LTSYSGRLYSRSLSLGRLSCWSPSSLFSRWRHSDRP
jgi:hypothetical protein